MSDAAAVRDYRAGDFEAVADILKRATRRAYGFMAWDHGDADFATFVASALPGWDRVRVAELDGRVAGFACLQGDVLDQLFVAPECQGRGVGSRLLDDVKGLRPAGFMLYTFQRNHAARAFYEKRGLVAVGTGLSEEEREPDVTYAWRPDGP